MSHPPSDIRYRVNDRDEIVFVNEAWNGFAERNTGAHLVSDRVLGQSLWSFVTDRTTRLLYRDVLARVRSGRSVQFTFRCDSPECRRRLEMTVSREPDGLIEFHIRTLAEEPRPPQALLDPDQTRTETMLRVCGWCKKVKANDRWLEVEEAVSALALFDQPRLPAVTHGICEACFERMTDLLEQEATPADSRPASGPRPDHTPTEPSHP